MSSTRTAAHRPEVRPETVAGPHRGPALTVRLLAVLIVIGTLIWLGRNVTWDDHNRPRPVDLAVRAVVSGHQVVAVISPERADRWTAGSGPRRAVAEQLSRPGNAYFAVPFSATVHEGSLDPGARAACYFFPVQRGRHLDAGRIIAITRFCYRPGRARAVDNASAGVGPRTP